MSKIDVSPEDLTRWAKGLRELGVSVRTKLEDVADTAGKAEANRWKDADSSAPRGATSAWKLNPAVLKLEAALKDYGTIFDSYAQSLTAALEGSASTVSTYDTNTGLSFAGTSPTGVVRQ